MGLKKNGKKVRIAPHESVDSQDSLEMDEFSDEEDEVFVRHDSEEAGKPLIRKKKKVRYFCESPLQKQSLFKSKVRYDIFSAQTKRRITDRIP